MLSLKAFLGLDATGFEVGIKRAQSMVNGFSHSLEHGVGHKIAEYLGAAAFEEGIRRAIEYGHHMSNVAKQMGITTDEAQNLDYQMSETGGSIETAANAFKKLAIAQSEAARGNEDAKRAFSALGINPTEAAGMSRSKLYNRIGGIVGGMGEGELPRDMAEALQKLMGKGADSLIPSFKMGMPQLSTDEIIPEAEIEKLHGYSSEVKKSGNKLRKFFADSTTFIAEWANVLAPAITEEDKRSRAEAIKYLADRKSGKLSEKSDGFIGPPRPPGQEQEPLRKEYYADFFNPSADFKKSPLNINSLQQLGAYVAGGSPIQNEMQKMTTELHSVGLTLKEFNNYARQIGKQAPGFNGASDGGIQGRGVEF